VWSEEKTSWVETIYYAQRRSRCYRSLQSQDGDRGGKTNLSSTIADR
jgi:hypothetical protein